MSTTRRRSTKTPSTAASPKPYVVIIERLKKLGQARTANYYETAKLLAKLSHNQEWLDKLAAELGLDVLDPNVVVEALDQFIPDCDFAASDLVQIYSHFPDPVDWKGRRIIDLFDDARERAARPAEQEPKPERKRAKLADLKKAETESRDFRKQVVELKHSSDTLVTRLAKAEARIDDLEEENAKLQRQVVDLQFENEELKRLAPAMAPV